MKQWYPIYLVIILVIPILATNFQRQTYMSYSPIINGNSEYHNNKILWSTNNIGLESFDISNSWKYSILRTGIVNTSFATNNNNDVFLRYSNFILGINGLNSKPYVAWNINVACASSTITVTFNIKYFICDDDSSAFYSNTLQTGTTHKVRATTTGLAQKSSDIIQIGSNPSNTKTIEKFLGIGSDYAFVPWCT